tara:strand:+ start:198 stop:500 length:303 start_codon:yes stop_codon:yes gene_type:complete
MLADGTYDKDGNAKAYPHGFQVGIWNKPINVKETHLTLEWLIKQMTETCDEFGAWTDTNGDLYIEPCVWIPDFDTAERVARALNQIAVWDWANMKEIRLN